MRERARERARDSEIEERIRGGESSIIERERKRKREKERERAHAHAIRSAREYAVRVKVSARETVCVRVGEAFF